MKTNKTPIQELFKMMDEHYAFVVSNADEWLEKEKQFARQCFNAGVSLGRMDEYIGMSEADPTESFKFEHFYSKYATRHNK